MKICNDLSLLLYLSDIYLSNIKAYTSYDMRYSMDAKKLLQQHHLKATPQRLEIVHILETYGHLSIDALYTALQKKFPSLSLATIYKNIHAMCNKHFLSEVKIPQQKSVYELTKEEHSHVVCETCNAIMDIDLNLSNIIEEAQALSDYKIDKSAIVLHGHCPHCLDNTNR